MRIRKRLLLQSSTIPPPPSDPQVNRPGASVPPLQPPSNPPKHPIDQSMSISSIISSWVFTKNVITDEQKMKQKGLANDDTFKGEEKINTNDIRRIVINNSDEEMGTKKNLQPSSSSSAQEYRVPPRPGGGDSEEVPLKKRKGILDENLNEEKRSPEMKSKTNNNCCDNMRFEVINGINESTSGGVKKIKRGSVIMEGSRCSRVNGRGWRCCQPTLMGYSLCEHHLGKGRLRTIASTVHRPNTSIGESGAQPLNGEEPRIVTKKRTRKARSLNSLLTQI